MEVHQHSHESHGKKTWKNYAWEFLMLFLAVFCGFMAEYFLEHKIEKEKGREYLFSFYDDLVTDTTKFAEQILDTEKKLAVLNTMFDCYDTITKNSSSTNCLKDLMNNSRLFIDLEYTDRTLQQFKSAGGLRLLKKDDADSIIVYDNMLRSAQKIESSFLQKSQDNLRDAFNPLVDFNAISQFNLAAGTGKLGIDTPLLFSTDKAMLNNYFNELFTYWQAVNSKLRFTRALKANAGRLILFFKEKYRI